MIIIKLLILFLNFAGWFSAINRFVKNYSFSIMLFPGIWIFLGYLSLFFGVTIYLYYAFMLFGIGYFSYDATKYFKTKQLNKIFPDEFKIFAAISLIWFIRTGFAYYSFPDEIYNWGIIMKKFFTYDGFASTAAQSVNDGIERYKNGTAIFNYYITKTIGFSEGYNIFANCLLFTMFVSFVFYNKKRLLSSILLYCVAVTPSIHFNPGYGGIYVDHIVAASFGALLVLLHNYRHNNKHLIFFSIPIFLATCLLKEVGFLLSYLAILYLFIILLLEKKLNQKNLLIIGIFCTIPLLIDYSWFALLEQKFAIHSKTSLTDKLAETKSRIDKGLAFIIIKNFFKSIRHALFYKFAGIIFLTSVLGCYIFINKNSINEKKQEFKRSLKIFIVMFLIYLCHRLFLYFNSPSVEEVTRGLPVVRYLNSFLTGTLFLILNYAKDSFLGLADSTYKAYLKAIKILIVIYLIIMSLNVRRKPYFSPLASRKLIQQEIEPIKANLKKGEKIYIVYNNVNDSDCLDLVYETAPYNNFINRCMDYSTDKKTKNIIEKDLINNLKIENFQDKSKANDSNKYDALYIMRADNEFWQRLEKEFSFNTTNPEKYKLFVRNNTQFEPVQ